MLKVIIFFIAFQVCNKAFKAKRSLQYHQYVHHGIEQTQSNIGEKYADTRKRKMDGEPDPANNSVNPFIKSFYAGLGTQNEATSGGSPFPWLNHGLMWNTLKRTMATATNGFEMPDENGNKKLLLDANTANTATDLSENNNNNGLKNYDLEQKVKVNGSHDPENSGLEKQVSVESNSRMILGRDIEEYLRLRECPFCGKVCPQRSDMKRHLMVHTGEKPFTCEVSVLLIVVAVVTIIIVIVIVITITIIEWIRSSDNDSTGYWPPGSLHTLGADGHI